MKLSAEIHFQETEGHASLLPQLLFTFRTTLIFHFSSTYKLYSKYFTELTSPVQSLLVEKVKEIKVFFSSYNML